MTSTPVCVEGELLVEAAITKCQLCHNLTHSFLLFINQNCHFRRFFDTTTGHRDMRQVVLY